MIAALRRRGRRGARGAERGAPRPGRLPGERRGPESPAGQGHAAAPWACRPASAGCRWGPPPGWLDERAAAMLESLAAWRAGRSVGAQCLSPSGSSSSAASARSAATARSSSTAAGSSSSTAGCMFPDAGDARRRPRAPGLLLPAETSGRRRRRSCSPTATRTTSAASATCCATSTRPIYGSALTLGLARDRARGGRASPRRPSSSPVTDGERRKIGPFDVEFIPVTHSVPARLRHGVPHRPGRRSCTRATSSST